MLIHADLAGESMEPNPLVAIVDKSRQEVSLYRYDGRWRVEAQWPCSTGKIRGRKETEGDKKTPEGVYFVTRDVGSRFLTETYGSRALPLDYPNWMDQRQQRSGSSIWIHGTNKPLKAYDSNGCVVMNNPAVSELADYLQLRQTPVIIVDHLERTSERRLRKISRTILSALAQWRDILNHGSYAAFKKCYAPEAQPTMTWWRRWCRQRHKQSLGSKARSIIRQRAVIRDGKNFVVLFDHYLATDAHRVWVGRRKFYLQVKDGQVGILNESYQSRAAEDKDPLFYAWKTLWNIDQRDRRVATGKKAQQRNLIAGQILGFRQKPSTR